MKLVTKNDSAPIVGNLPVKTSSMGIDQSQIGKLQYLLSKGLYSRPIESIVREVTSNAVDATIEAGSNQPVIVDIEYENGISNFTVEDFGVGLSEERINKIYCNYLASTKEATNNQLGCFGLGAKSPLTYTDTFTIKTRYNGFEYLYVMSNTGGGDSGQENSITQIYKKETTEINGTKVTIPLKKGDETSFKNAVKVQLCYFKGVYINYLTSQKEIKEYNNFSVAENPPSTSIHINMGGVYYPIDFTKVTNFDIRMVDIAVGIHVEIGKIAVTPNRESIIYDKSTVSYLETLINTCASELEEILEIEVKRITVEMYRKSPYHNIGTPSGQEILFKYVDFDKGSLEWELPVKMLKKVANLFESVNYKKYLSRSGRGSKRCICKLSEGTNFILKTGGNSKYKDLYLRKDLGFYEELPIVSTPVGVKYLVQRLFRGRLNHSEFKYSEVKKLWNYYENYLKVNMIDYDTLVVPKDFLDANRPEKVVRDKSLIKCHEICYKHDFRGSRVCISDSTDLTKEELADIPLTILTRKDDKFERIVALLNVNCFRVARTYFEKLNLPNLIKINNMKQVLSNFPEFKKLAIGLKIQQEIGKEYGYRNFNSYQEHIVGTDFHTKVCTLKTYTDAVPYKYEALESEIVEIYDMLDLENSNILTIFEEVKKEMPIVNNIKYLRASYFDRVDEDAMKFFLTQNKIN